MVTAEEKEDGILIRPAAVVAVERYSPERKAGVFSYLTSSREPIIAAHVRRFEKWVLIRIEFLTPKPS